MTADALDTYPPPPRHLTPFVRRRLWLDPRVRFGWMVAAALLAAAVYFVGRGYLAWADECRIVATGTPVNAVVLTVDSDPNPGHPRPPGTLADLEAEIGNKEVRLTGPLAGQREYIFVGEKVIVRIDPRDPTRWTGWQERPPLLPSLLGGAMLGAAGILTLIPAALRRAHLASIWKTGAATPAVVREVRQTALAPRSRIALCAPPSGQGRLIAVVVPGSASHSPLSAGDTTWLLHPPGQPARAVGAAWFDESPAPTPALTVADV